LKKTLSLIILICLSVTLGLTVKAESFSYNDMSQPQLNGLSLNEVFEDTYISYDGDLMQNINYSPSLFDTENANIWYNDYNFIGNKYYLYTELNNLINLLDITNIVFTDAFNYIGYIKPYILGGEVFSYYKLSLVTPVFVDYFRYRINTPNNIRGSLFFMAVDLTTLGISNVSVDTLDFHYQKYIDHIDSYVLEYDEEELNPIDIIEYMWELLLDWSDTINDFLFHSQTIGYKGIVILGVTMFNFSFSFVPFYAIGTGTVTTLLLLYLAKKFVPMA